MTLSNRAKSFCHSLRLLGIIIIIPIIALVVLSYQANVALEVMKENYEQNIQNVNDSRWILIHAVIKENQEKGRMQVAYVKNRIEARLSQEYGLDYTRLKQDLESNQDNKAYQIMSEEVSGKFLNVNNDNNDMFIATNNRVIIDMSINCSVSKLTRSWDEEIAMHSNQKLAKEAINLITSKSNPKYNYWKFLPDEIYIPKEEQLIYPSIESMKNIYNKYGVKGLKPYEFLIPTYIKQDTDIFGVPDVNFRGIKNENSKLIIVQGFNVVDALEKDYAGEMAYFKYLEDLHKKELDRRVQEIAMSLFMNGALSLLSLVGACIVAKFVSNWGGDDDFRGCGG